MTKKNKTSVMEQELEKSAKVQHINPSGGKME
jgi:hypothetical protein